MDGKVYNMNAPKGGSVTRHRDARGNNILCIRSLDNKSQYCCDERVVYCSAGIAAGIMIGSLSWFVNMRRVKGLRLNVIRAKRDADAAREIAARDISSAKKFGSSSLIKDLLVSLDNIDRCVDNRYSSDVVEGIKLTQTDLQKTLTAHSVAVIPLGVGDRFDPDVCEAMMQTPLPSAATSGTATGTIDVPSSNSTELKKVALAPALPGSISQVLMKGYTHHGRVLRPVKVAVYADVTDSFTSLDGSTSTSSSANDRSSSTSSTSNTI